MEPRHQGGSGTGNCRAWTSNASGDDGSEGLLTPPAGWLLPAVVITPWTKLDVPCSAAINVWYVEDEP